ncbi:MAG: collagen-like protein [Arthrobacter sp.]|nr:collagen-like protein [Arthrobacter sp.]
MPDEINDDALARAEARLARSHRGDRRTKYGLLVLATLLAVALLLAGWLAVKNHELATANAAQADAQEASKRSLAEQVATACVRDDFKASPQGKQLCQRAQQVVQEPRQITGPQGIPGADGLDGADGRDGKDGVNGRDGRPGLPGEDGAAGLPGSVGAQGAKGDAGVQGLPGEKGEKGDPGAQGPKGDKGDPGEKGADGKDGLTPRTIIFDGKTYTCTPDPPESTTLACTAMTTSPSP